MNAAPALTEAVFQQQVTDLAELYGWEWVHLRPARTEAGWRTPVSGTLGAGWPDLVLVRGRDRRVIFAELKSQRGRPTREQVHVLELLDLLTGPGFDVCIWRPSDLPAIQAVLR